jgi:hypothetical protein
MSPRKPLIKCKTREKLSTAMLYGDFFPLNIFDLGGLVAWALTFSMYFCLYHSSVLSICFIFTLLSIYIFLCLLCHASAVSFLWQRCKIYIRVTVLRFAFKCAGHRNTHGWTLLAIASSDKIFTFSVYIVRVESRAIGPTGGQGELCTYRPGAALWHFLAAPCCLHQTSVHFDGFVLPVLLVRC